MAAVPGFRNRAAKTTAPSTPRSATPPGIKLRIIVIYSDGSLTPECHNVRVAKVEDVVKVKVELSTPEH